MSLTRTHSSLKFKLTFCISLYYSSAPQHRSSQTARNFHFNFHQLFFLFAFAPFRFVFIQRDDREIWSNTCWHIKFVICHRTCSEIPCNRCLRQPIATALRRRPCRRRRRCSRSDRPGSHKTPIHFPRHTRRNQTMGRWATGGPANFRRSTNRFRGHQRRPPVSREVHAQSNRFWIVNASKKRSATKIVRCAVRNRRKTTRTTNRRRLSSGVTTMAWTMSGTRPTEHQTIARRPAIRNYCAKFARNTSARVRRCKYTCAHTPATSRSPATCARNRFRPRAIWRLVPLDGHLKRRAYLTSRNFCLDFQVHMGTHMWTNASARRGRRMSFEIPPNFPPPPNHFMHTRPEMFHPYMNSAAMFQQKVSRTPHSPLSPQSTHSVQSHRVVSKLTST